MARSWREHRTLLLVCWLVTAGACAWSSLTHGMYHFHDFREEGTGRWAGVFTVLSAMCLAAAGFFVLLVARDRFLRQGWNSAVIAWALAGGGGVFLALDDLLQLHEGIARRLAAAGVPPPFGFGDHDLYVFGFYAACAFWVGHETWSDLVRLHRAALPGIAAVLCFLVSGVFDMAPWEQLSEAERAIVGPAEETAKTLGSVNLALFALLLNDHRPAREPDP